MQGKSSGALLILIVAFSSAPCDEEPTLMEMNDPAYLLAHSGPWQRHETPARCRILGLRPAGCTAALFPDRRVGLLR